MSKAKELAGGAVRLSISQIATEFKMSRRTVSQFIENTGVNPSGERAGYPIYRLADVLGLLTSTAGEDGPAFDPMKAKPAERRAWFQSENERLKFEQESGHLILAEECRSEMATLAKITVRFLETLSARTERDLRCGPEVIEYLDKRVREIRTEIADRVINEDADDA